jgi:hypothetical protein
MNDLHDTSTLDLLIELSRRAIQREHGPTDPILSLIKLSGAMASMLNIKQRYRIINELRDLADALELKEHVGVQ